MTIIDVACDEFKQCDCGFTPIEFSIGYGPTPYNVHCKCGKNLYDAKCDITNNSIHLIAYWNEYMRFTSREDLKAERQQFLEEKIAVERLNVVLGNISIIIGVVKANN